MSDDESEAWKILKRRRALSILKSIGSKGELRYSEVKRSLLGISNSMLAERLLELQHEGLVAKTVYGSKIEYRLTAGARELEYLLTRFERWWSALSHQ